MARSDLFICPRGSTAFHVVLKATYVRFVDLFFRLVRTSAAFIRKFFLLEQAQMTRLIYNTHQGFGSRVKILPLLHVCLTRQRLSFID